MKKKQLIREQFRTAVFTRDKNTCKIKNCQITENLDAHHITDRSEMPNGGYVKENGITVCPDHHLMAEKFHISEGKEWEEGMHPDELYRMIGSSKEIALAKSEKLSRKH